MPGPPEVIVIDSDDEVALSSSEMCLSILAPLQTSHSTPTDPASTPAVVAFDEAAFHDYECLVDWGYLAQLTAKRMSEALSAPKAAAAQAKSPVVMLPGFSRGTKRGRSDSTGKDAELQPKLSKVSHVQNGASSSSDVAEDVDMLDSDVEWVEAKPPVHLARTSLLFRLSPQGDDNEMAAALLSTVASSNAPLSLTRCYLESPSQDAEVVEGQLRISKLKLHSADDVHIATLPIVSLVNAPLERQAYTWTNGAWLPAATRLAETKVIEMNVDLLVRSAQAHEQVAAEGASSVTLELKINLALLPAAFSPTTDVNQAEHLMQLMRFISPSAEREATIRACGSRVSADFIYSNLKSSKLEASPALQPVQLAPNLMPFQRRSVNFLLGREGYQLKDAQGRQPEEGLPLLRPVQGVQSTDGLEKLGLWWEQVGERKDLFFDTLSARFSLDAAEAGQNIRAAILGEEMGLGKTVEVLALVLLNPAPQHIIEKPQPYYDKTLELEVTPAKTTLIVCPEILRQQWLDEAAVHAGELKVYSFVTRKRAEQDKPKDKSWAEWAAEFDIIVVSFDTLSTELHVAKAERPRSRRFDRKYERPRSPLVMLRYHRVIMDEVQLVGQSGAADTVSMIERTSSIAVSGTPIRRGDYGDLRSLFRFLRVPSAPVGAQWQRLLGPSMAHSLGRVLNILATRHLKIDVKDEMTLPTQTRWLVPIELGPVQRVFYDDQWNTALQDLGLNANGEPMHDMYEPDIDKLRRHLLLLRRSCTHPQVAQAVVPVVGGNGSRAQMSTSKTIQDMDTVLERMIDAAATTRDNLFLTLRQKSLNSAALLLQNKASRDAKRLEKVRELLEAEQRQLEAKIDEFRETIKAARSAGPLYSFTEDELAALVDHPSDDEDDDSEAGSEEREGTQGAGTRTLKERLKLRAKYVAVLKSRMRLFQEQLHRALHTLGSVFYQLGERDLQLAAEQAQKAAGADNVKAIDVDAAAPEEAEAPASAVSPFKAEEDAAYAAAEVLRRELLVERLSDTERAAAAVRRLKTLQIDEAEEFDDGGIQSQFEFEKLNELSELLDQNAKVIESWRSQILERILKAVNREVDQSNENDDQYAEALDDQAEAEALMEMYRVLLAERERILSGHAAVEATAKPRLFTALEQQVKAAKRAAIMGAQLDGEGDPALVPDAEQLHTLTQQLNHFKRLEVERKEASLKQKDDHSIVDIITRLREVAERALRKEEVALAQDAAQRARSMLKKQKTALEKLNREQAVFSRLYNARSSYFKQMQSISDSVSDVLVHEGIEADREKLAAELKELTPRHGDAMSRVSWLGAVKNMKDTECEICKEDYTVQCVMPCGHVLCRGCVSKITVCTRCRRPVHDGTELQLISLPGAPAEEEPEAEEKDEAGKEASEDKAVAPKPVRYVKPTYNLLSPEERRQIEAVRIEARYGSKLHLLTQHLVHIQNTEPSSKTIVFSSFATGLDLVSQALKVQGISHVRVDGGGKVAGKAVNRFREEQEDDGVNVLLLHSEAQSAGLNLLCATRIILLEPLVNHAAELQALGRIHRIGQTRKTNIYCYSANNTVEERICNAQAARGQSLYLQGQASSANAREALTLAAPVKMETDEASMTLRRQGERVNTLPELLACFFDAHTAKQAIYDHFPQQEQQAEGSNAAQQRRERALAAAEQRRRQNQVPVL